MNLNEENLARALGWFSIALGLAQLVAPRRMSSIVGADPHPLLMRLLGMREVTSGLGILSQRHRPGWAGSRVAGDVLDLGLLAASLLSPGTARSRVAASAAAVAGVTALDVLCTRQLNAAQRPLRVEEAATINRPVEEVYHYWRWLENLPSFMRNLESVTVRDSIHSHWVARGPAGVRLEWNSEIVEERPDEIISWRSLEPSDIWHAGAVRFQAAPQGRGTVVHLKMAYRAPLGAIGKPFAHELKQALRYFKMIMEAGEIATTQGQPRGRTRPSAVRALEYAGRGEAS